MGLAWRRRAAVVGILALLSAALAGCGSDPRGPGGAAAPASTTTAPSTTVPATAPSTTAPSTTAPSTTVPATTPSTTAPSTTVPATAPSTTAPPTTAVVGSDFRAGTVTAIGDSVMLDYGSDLAADLPGRSVDVQAAVSRQFSSGISVADQLRSAHALGSAVVVDLGTNGTVTPGEVDEMAGALRGASLIVFVTVHVDQSWQAEVNGTLRAVVPTIPHAVIADWAALAGTHPGWFYSDGTHLPIGGPGAEALARLVARAVLTGASD